MDELWKDPYNRFCADCSKPNPDKINLDLEIIICSYCADIHGKLPVGFNRVCDVFSEFFDARILDLSDFTGNLKNNNKFEHSVPAFLKKPNFESPSVLKEQWILAKYGREEFTQDGSLETIYHDVPSKSGLLWKKGKFKNNNHFRQRYFILDRSHELLSYYLEKTDSKPKLSTHIDNVYVYLGPEKIENSNSMQFVIKENGTRRSIFTYAENSEEIYAWYMAIRSIKWGIFKYLNHYEDKEILYKMVPHGYIKQGWLYKSGRKPNDRVLLRWFCLEHDNIVYSVDPLDHIPKGEISLVNREGIKAFLENEVSIVENTFCLSLRTPHRTYYFASYEEFERRDWYQKIRSAIEKSKTEIVQKF